MKIIHQTTRSPLALARVALAVGEAALPAYGSRFSRRDFTQPQLFALLCLKAFLHQDYRGLIALLADWSDLRQALRLRKLPHYSTLCYAEARLSTRPQFERLLAGVFSEGPAFGLLQGPGGAAVACTRFVSRDSS